MVDIITRPSPSRFFATTIAVACQGAFAQATPPSTDDKPATELPAVTVKGKATIERQPDQIVERTTQGSALFGTSDLRTVPLTVHIVTDVEIANRQAKTLGQALAGDPAVINDYGGTGGYPTESFNIRGFSIAGGDAFLKDGMPMAGQVTQGTENIEQIEVVRGPVGFRYGYLPPGGAINLVSKRPTDTPLRSLTISSDQYGSAKGHLDLGGRAGEGHAFGYRINAAVEDSKLFFKPTERKRNFLSGAFDWRVKPDTTLTLALDRNDFRSGPDLFHYTVPDVNGNEIKGVAPTAYFGQKFLPDNDFVVQTGSFGIESRLTQNLSFSTRFAVYDWDAFYALSIPYNAQPNGDFNVLVSKSRYTQLSKTNTTYLNYKIDGDQVQHAITGGFTWQQGKGTRAQGSVAAPLLAAGTDTPVVNNFFHPVQFADTTAAVTGPMAPWVDTRQISAFVSDEIKLAARWRLLLALRHGKLTDNSAYQLRPGGTSSTDPTVGAMFELSPAVSVYGSYATGLENGGIAPATATNAFDPLPPIKSRQVEIGIKSDLAGGQLTLDGSLFRIDKTAEFTNPDNVYVQSGRQVHTGAEVRLIGQLTPTVTVTTGLQILHAILTGDPATASSRPQNVPKLHATFSGDWRIVAMPGLFLTSGVYHVGEREINVPNIPAKAPAYTRIDLGARFETKVAGNDVIARLNVENVANTAYYNVGWYSLYEAGAPRMVSASLQLKF